MSRISSTGITTSAGLVTGIPIEDTVNQLIALQAQPRNTLAQRNQGLQAEQAAVDQLSSLVLATRLSLNSLNLRRTFDGRLTTSSQPDVVSASAQSGATPSTGSYQFTTLRQASSHQLVSGRIDDVSELSGSLSLGFGGQVDKGIELSQLNGGAGFDSGSIRITDRAGNSATIDLRGAQTVDDVLDAINTSIDIDVTASVDGDRFVLTDLTGESGNLRVREVAGGTTAESLGLDETASGDTITGRDVYALGADTRLADLRDGLGVETAGAGDLEITLADGETTASIDLSEATTLGDVLDAINNNTDLGGLLTAEINPDGDGLVLTDTSGSGDLVVAGTSADALGIATGESAGTTVTGDRLISGLRDTLVSTLGGGTGITLGEIDVTDRAGNSTTIDLAGAETLAEVINTINSEAEANGVAVTASVNSARNGIALEDTSGGTGSLVVAEVNSGTTAAALGIAIDDATATADGGTLNRQTVSRATRLEDFNGGRGVQIADFTITDSAGRSSTIQVERTDDNAETIGDVIDRINAAGADVTASLNATGDGILVTDNAGGTGVLTIAESGSSTTAADLGLLGDSTTTNDDGQQTINGSTTYSVDLSDLENSAAATSLASLNDGDGVELGIFQITSTDGTSFTVDLGSLEADAQAIGDVIDRINAAATEAGQAVTASLNENESGIILTDSQGGSAGELTVEDLGSNTTAADLNLAGTGGDDNEIDGRGLFTFNGDNALQTLADRINELEAGITAGVFNDGTGFRLSLTSDRTGAGNEILVDGLGSLGFEETSRAGDAVALFGGLGGIGGFVVTSETNDFSDVIDGVTLTANQATGEPVTIDIAQDNSPVLDAAQDFVDAYNSLRTNLEAVTDFDAEAGTTGLLFGRNEALRVDTELSRLLTDRYFVNGEATTLQEVGISVDAEGRLSLDRTRLSEALDESPQTVEDLFRDEDNGVVAKLNETIDRLAGDDSLLSARSDALGRTIESNTERIATLDARLERQREQLLLEFIRLE
ncbi:MAG: flagellar filament capping protein FliD, partial [Planctomycetota bacterium]